MSSAVWMGWLIISEVLEGGGIGVVVLGTGGIGAGMASNVGMGFVDELDAGGVPGLGDEAAVPITLSYVSRSFGSKLDRALGSISYLFIY